MFFLALFFLLLSSSNIFADDFDINGDGVNNSYFQTVAFTTEPESFPPKCIGAVCIDYDTSTMLWWDTSESLTNESIFSLTDFGNMRRIPMVADRVEGPPGTKVDVLYYYFNNTGHDVNISKIVVPFSREGLIQSGLPTLVSFPNGQSVIKTIDTLFNGHTVRKDGYLKEYEGLGIVDNNAFGVVKIDEFYISHPINIDDWKIEESNGDLTVKVWIQNNSAEYLNNISFEHMGYTEKFDIDANSEKLLQYTLKDMYHGEESLSLGYFHIENANEKMVCATTGSNYYDWYQSWAVTAFAYRDNVGWVNGAHVQPTGRNSLCIRRIPYKINSEAIYYEKKEKEDQELVGEEVGTTTSTNPNTVLGISDTLKILPKTSKFDIWFFPFLVVDVYLWYSFFKIRRKYESKNTNTRICTKGSENLDKRGL